jgi:MFS family permease
MLFMSGLRSLKVSKKKVGVGLLIVGGQVLTVATVPDLIAQPLQIWLNQQMEPTEVVMIIVTYSVFATIGGLLFGQLTDKYGAPKVIRYVSLLLLVIYCIYPVAQDTWEYMVMRILHALLFALIANAPIILIRSSIPRRVQARVMGTVMAGSYLGSGLALMTGVLLADNPPLLWFTVIALGVFSVGLNFSAIMLINGSVIQREEAKEQISKAYSTFLMYTKGMVVWEAFIIALPSVGVSVTQLSFVTWFAIYAGQQAGVILLVSTLANVGSLLTYMPVLVVKRSYRFVMWFSILTMMAALILIWIGGSFWIFLFAGILIGVALAGTSLCISEEINNTIPRQLGAGYATAGILRQLGGVVGILYSGMMWSVLGSSNMWISLIPILALSMVAALVVPRFVKRKPSPSLDKTVDIMMKLLGYVLAGQPEEFSLTVSKHPDLFRNIERVHKSTPWVQKSREPRDPLDNKKMIIHKLDHFFTAIVLLQAVFLTNQRGKKAVDVFSVREEQYLIQTKIAGILQTIEDQNLQATWYKNWISSGRWVSSSFVYKDSDLGWEPNDNADEMVYKLFTKTVDYAEKVLDEIAGKSDGSYSKGQIPEEKIPDVLFAVHLLTGRGKNLWDIRTGKWSQMLVAGAMVEKPIAPEKTLFPDFHYWK